MNITPISQITQEATSLGDNDLLIVSKNDGSDNYTTAKMKGSVLKTSGTQCQFSSDTVKTACQQAIESKSISTVTVAQIQELLNNTTYKPSFYDFQNAVSINQGGYVVVTPETDGILFVSNSGYNGGSSGSPRGTSIYIGEVTSTTADNALRLAYVGYNGLLSTSETGHEISSNFSIQLKRGQTITISLVSNHIKAVFVPFL